LQNQLDVKNKNMDQLETRLKELEAMVNELVGKQKTKANN
jgi:chaperonin cofactor prefoldin